MCIIIIDHLCGLRKKTMITLNFVSLQTSRLSGGSHNVLSVTFQPQDSIVVSGRDNIHAHTPDTHKHVHTHLTYIRT